MRGMRSWPCARQSSQTLPRSRLRVLVQQMITRILLARSTIASLALSEEGRHEDHESDLADWNATPPEKRDQEDEPRPALAYVCAMAALASSASSRYATIVIDDASAAEDLYYAVCSGTFQVRFPRQARRIADALRDRVLATDPALVARWPAPSES